MPSYILALIGFLTPYLPRYVGQIVKLIEIGEPVFEAVKKAWPIAAPIIKEIAAHAFPETVGTPEWPAAKELTAKAIFVPHTMTRDEEERWFKRASGDGSGGN